MRTASSKRFSRAGGGLAAVSLLVLAFWPTGAQAYEAVPIDDSFLERKSPVAWAIQINGRAETLRVGDGTGSAPKYHSFIKFNLSTAPENLAAENIEKATLKLFVNEVANAGSFEVHQLLDGWNEDTLNGSNPAFGIGGPFVAGPIFVGVGEEYVLVDLTAFVKDLVDAGESVANLALVPVDDSVLQKAIYVHFDGKESDDTSHDPRLEIVLVSVGPTGATGVTGGTGSDWRHGAHRAHRQHRAQRSHGGNRAHRRDGAIRSQRADRPQRSNRRHRSERADRSERTDGSDR